MFQWFMITLVSKDQLGIVAKITTDLAEGGFNILALESDVGGADYNPFYIINMVSDMNTK